MSRFLFIAMILVSTNSVGQVRFGLVDCIWNKAEYEEWVSGMYPGSDACAFIPAIDTNKAVYHAILPTYRDSTNELVYIRFEEKHGQKKTSCLIIFLDAASARVIITDATNGDETSFYSNKRKRRFKKLIKKINQVTGC